MVGMRAEFDQRHRETVSRVVSALVYYISTNIQYPNSSFLSAFSSISYHATAPDSDTDRHKSILSARESLLSCNPQPFIHASIYAILKDVRCSSKANEWNSQVAGSRCAERIFASFVPYGCGFQIFLISSRAIALILGFSYLSSRGYRHRDGNGGGWR